MCDIFFIDGYTYFLVAIATAISLTGLGSGAANMGIVAACVTFLFGSLRVNSIGVNLVLLIGAAKMMIPVYLKNLIIAIPLTLNGIICGIVAYLLNIKGHHCQLVLVIQV